MAKKILNPGEKAELPDGRTVTFIEVDMYTLGEPCYGCAFEYERCELWHEYVGPCGSARPDGIFGIFVEHVTE